MPEFALIERLAGIIPVQGPGVELSIGDDAALLAPEPGKRLVVSTDTLNESIHFLPDADPGGVGHKALAVSLSDLAAMGAEPRWALLNLSLPGADEAWLEAFCAGFAKLATTHGVTLVGGDTCEGPRSVTVTVLGSLAAGGSLRRDGAGAGDLVVVSGALGDAALALSLRQAGQEAGMEGMAALERPTPRLALGQGLRPLASACIDLSDGLYADVGHIARASGLGVEIDLGALPASPALLALPEEKRWNLQLCGGDDYELCFTVPAARRDEVQDLGDHLGLPLAVVGRMVTGDDVRCLRPDGRDYTPERPAWEHFRRRGLES